MLPAMTRSYRTQGVAEVEGRWRKLPKSKDTLWGEKLGEAQALPGGAAALQGLWCRSLTG